MKNIKYRVWVSDENRYRYCEFVPTLGFVWNITKDINKQCAANLDFLEIGENYPEKFIGSYDSKGEPIYEGDIVEYIEKMCELGDVQKLVAKVVYDDKNSAFALASFEDEIWNHFNDWTVYNFKIVGNINENGDLLV